MHFIRCDAIGLNKISEPKVYTSPATSCLFFQSDFSSDRAKTVSISDEKCVVVQVFHAAGFEEKFIDVSSLKTGLYYLNIEGLNAVPFLKY